ncbi:MAG: Hsp20/alpha crystallin family protein [Candidatus Thermoplasmatota archaeon]|nr:Hsp20/alpha crystallin family protein [Candidatus Thermoplasmatota archaeon]
MVRKKEKKVDIEANNRKKTSVDTTPPAVWNPLELIENVDRFLMDDFWNPLWWRRRSPFSPYRDQLLETDTKLTPLDLIDAGDKYKVVAEMPGVSKKDVEVNITPNAINICGEKKYETEKDEQGYIRHERSYSTICRSIAFPEEVLPDKADATLSDGILEVHVSKKTPTKSKGRKIPVK